MGHRQASFPLGLALALVFGCGMSDYEQRIDHERTRMKVFDEENKVLENVIEMPKERVVLKTKDKDTETDVNGWPFDIFLRAPKDIAKKVDEKEGRFVDGPLKLYLYKGTAKDSATNLLVAASNIESRDKEGNLKDPRALPVKVFERHVLDALNQYLKANKLELSQFKPRPMDSVEFQPERIGNEKPAEVKCDLIEYEYKGGAKGLMLKVYFRRDGQRQVAIVYQIPLEKAHDAAVLDSIRFGMRWLDIGDTATQRRQTFLREHRPDLPVPKT